MWDSADEKADEQVNDFFAGMDDRDADEIFNS